MSWIQLPLEDLLRPLGFPQPTSSATVYDANVTFTVNRLASRLVAIAERRPFALADTPANQPPRNRTQPGRGVTAVAAETVHQLATERHEVVDKYNALIRDFGVTSVQSQMHAELARLTERHFNDYAEAARQRWEVFDHGCMLSAVMLWARERLNSARNNRRRTRSGTPTTQSVMLPFDLPLNPSGRIQQRLAELHHPDGNLFLEAQRQLSILLHTNPGLGHQCATTLNVIAWCCGLLPSLTPPLVQRRLRAVHRQMIASVSHSLRRLDDARVLGLDRPRPRRERGRQPQASPGEPNPPLAPPLRAESELARRNPAPALLRTLSWLHPNASNPEEAVRRARQTWREERNQQLHTILTTPTEPDVQRPSYLPAQPPAQLLDLFPRDLQAIIISGSVSPPDDPQRRLDALWCRYHDGIASGYLLPSGTAFTPSETALPETRWINLIRTTSTLYNGLQNGVLDTARTTDSDPGMREPAFATRSHVGVTTYQGHRAPSYDLDMPVERAIRLTRPTYIHIGHQLLGDDPGAPRGRYVLNGMPQVRQSESTPVEEVFTKVVHGLFGRSGIFRVRWPQVLHTIPERQRNEIAPPSRPRRFEQYLYVWDNQSIPLPIRELLLNANGSSHPRQPDPTRMLAALFLRVGRSESQPLQRFRNSARVALYHAIQPRWEAARAAHPTWTAAAWQAILCHVFYDGLNDRENQGAWQHALLTGETYMRRLIPELLSGIPNHLGPASECAHPVALPGGLGIPSGSNWVSTARAVLTPVVEEIAAQTRITLNNAIGSSNTDTAFHRIINEFLRNQLLGTQPAVPNSGERPFRENEGRTEADQSVPSGEPRDAGSVVRVIYEYRLVEQQDGTPTNANIRLWVEVEFKHLSAVIPVPPNGLHQDGTLAYLGESGLTGNAVSGHTHMELRLWAQPPNAAQARPVAVISPLDFLGPVVWEGVSATGQWPIS